MLYDKRIKREGIVDMKKFIKPKAEYNLVKWEQHEEVYPNGKIKLQCNIDKNGQLQGIYKAWDENGELKLFVVIEDDHIIKKSIYDKQWVVEQNLIKMQKNAKKEKK